MLDRADRLIDRINKGWHKTWGDRRQEIVFIGSRDMDKAAIIAELDACLLATAPNVEIDTKLWQKLPDPFPEWLSEADLDYYVGEFERSGFRGPLNRYRNHDRDFDYLRQFTGRKIEQPAFFIGGSKDPAFNLAGRGDPLAIMRKEVTDLRVAEVLDGCGHWTQQERPDEVNARLIPWLKSL